MKVAILGTRGVPANYGGFETLAEELGRRLADRGHEVTVYGRRGFVEPSLSTYRGMRLVVLPSIRTKHLETVTHTFVSALHAAFARYDAVLLCNAANAPFIPILRWTGIPVAINVDGLERKRRKWGAAGRAYYRLCERLAARLPNRLVTDARVIQRYYRRFYHRPSEMIAYGGDLEPPQGQETLDRLGLEPEAYVLLCLALRAREQPGSSARGLVAGGWRSAAGHGRRRPLCRRVDPSDPRTRRRPCAAARDGLRRRLPRAALQLPGLRPRHRGRGHAPGAGGGHGRRPSGAVL